MSDVALETRITEPRENLTVFLLGFQVNVLRRPRRWWRLVTRFRQMAEELHAEPDRGLLHSRTLVGARGVTSVQYWRGTEELMRYARDSRHAAAWQEYYRRRDGASGIWHETYEVGVPQSGDSRGYEAIYVDVGDVGLGAALGTRPLTHEVRRARDRLVRVRR